MIEIRSKVYKKLTEMHSTKACKEYIKGLELLEKECGFSYEKIPQLQDVSDYLNSMPNFN